MKPSDFSRSTLCSCAAAAMLFGCGGSQPPIGVPGAMPQSRAITSQAEHNGDLIYAAGNEHSYVLSYPAGKLLGTIDAGANGACSDSNGNVFLTADDNVLEYKHGGTIPIATLSLPGAANAIGCSIDPTTGNLAVAFSTSSGGNLAVFQEAQGTPTIYKDDIETFYCGYDNNSDLFVDGYADNEFALTELPSGSSTFINISVSPSITENPGQVQWDGSYVTVEGGVALHQPRNAVAIYRLQLSGSTATIVGTTHFKGAMRDAYQSWINDNTILIPFGTSGDQSRAPNIGLWNYPTGEKARKLLQHFAPKLSSFSGVTVSKAQK